MMRFSETIRRKFGREDGNSSIDTVIMLPVFLFLFASVFELGMAMTRLTLLERGLDGAMRDLRLATNQVVKHDQIRDRVCDYAGYLKDCEDNLFVELTQIKRGNTWTNPTPEAKCIDRTLDDVKPATLPSDGEANDVVFIRACFIVKPFVPTYGLSEYLQVDSKGYMKLVAYSAFAREPS